MSNDDLSGAAGVLIFFVVVVATEVLIAWMLWRTLSRIPARHRTVEAWYSWLTLIPLAGIVFYWILIPNRVPSSLSRYFAASEKEEAEKSDYGARVGFWFTLLATLCIVPILNMVAVIPAIVLGIIYFIKLSEITKRLPAVAFDTASQRYEERLDGGRLALLERLKDLLDKGAITQEEYDREKQKLLAT